MAHPAKSPSPPDTTPPRKAVVFCVDQTYLPFALFLATQIHDATPGRDFDFCLISDTPLDIPEAFLPLNIRCYGAVTDETYTRLKVAHLPRSAYLRLWAPLVLGQDYDRILYLDADIFADGGGLSRLLETDLGGAVLAAVRDVQQWYRPKRNVKEFRLLGQPLTPYFNSGVLLMDTARYRQENILQRCLTLAEQRPDVILHHDQTLLNGVLAGRWTELSPVWNWQWPMKYPLFGDWAGARLSHFIGPVKPWNDTAGQYPQRYYNAYAAFFAHYFPGSSLIAAPGRPIVHSRWRSVKLLLRHIALHGRLLRYLDRFPDPYGAET